MTVVFLFRNAGFRLENESSTRFAGAPPGSLKTVDDYKTEKLDPPILVNVGST